MINIELPLVIFFCYILKSLEDRIESCEDVASKEKYNVIKVTAEAMIEAIKHSIVMLQISKESLKGPVMNGTMHEQLLTQNADFEHFSTLEADNLEEALTESPALSTPSSSTMPEVSYSSSDDDDFFDAEEFKATPKHSPQKKENADTSGSETQDSTVCPTVITSDDDYYDELYDERDSEDLGSLESHGSIIAHLLSQVRIGMDLTKVVLPTFILERRSLLEMFADFFAHPDLFVKIADMETPRDRMTQLIRWYLSAFHAGRSSDIAKKPYNPILGETFLCFWNMPDEKKSNDLSEDGPVAWSSKDNLSFIAEQVSHHPPISAFYAEHFNKKISLDGYIWTKSKFLGLSIGVHMIGQAVVSLIDRDEDYILTFPNGYGRSILTVPWVELGGKINISCAKTGYNANIVFHTKPFYGGKKNRVTCEIFEPNEKKPYVSIEGEWNGVMYAKYATGMNEAFIDTKKMPIIKKCVKPTDVQTEFESRRLWKDVTRSLKNKDVEAATEFKHKLEQRQREEAKERKEKGIKWETKHFHEVGEHWLYDRPLLKRLKSSPSGTQG